MEFSKSNYFHAWLKKQKFKTPNSTNTNYIVNIFLYSRQKSKEFWCVKIFHEHFLTWKFTIFMVINSAVAGKNANITHILCLRPTQVSQNIVILWWFNYENIRIPTLWTKHWSKNSQNLTMWKCFTNFCWSHCRNWMGVYITHIC